MGVDAAASPLVGTEQNLSGLICRPVIVHDIIVLKTAHSNRDKVSPPSEPRVGCLTKCWLGVLNYRAGGGAHSLGSGSKARTALAGVDGSCWWCASRSADLYPRVDREQVTWHRLEDHTEVFPESEPGRSVLSELQKYVQSVDAIHFSGSLI